MTAAELQEMRLLVFGGRHFKPQLVVWREISRIIGLHPLERVKIGHGKCPTGADYYAHTFAEHHKGSGLIECPYPADWDNLDAPGAVVKTRSDGKQYNVRAGFERNGLMLVQFDPTDALELPGGTGTADMRLKVEAAIRNGKRIKLTTIDFAGKRHERHEYRKK
jgi:hypothetical protein